ncbi:MAG: ribonuclease HII [Chloroflexi bacterium]|nr:ribonuclease HII [Chloroflexota bacterium]MCL5074931.1 ribonuclease HII [Chloroflexota bacterium]
MGYDIVAGIDEAGRGCLAGPVVAAAVILPHRCYHALGRLENVRDSKLLTPEQRKAALTEIEAEAIGIGVGAVLAEVIDEVGIVAATRLAMIAAVKNLPLRPDFLLIDYLGLPALSIPQKSIVDGDMLCLSIAAASIVAKVRRDRLMIEQDICYAGYGFARHKGYSTPEHLRALARLGVCPLHRHSFAPVRDMLDDERE